MNMTSSHDSDARREMSCSNSTKCALTVMYGLQKISMVTCLIHIICTPVFTCTSHAPVSVNTYQSIAKDGLDRPRLRATTTIMVLTTKYFGTKVAIDEAAADDDCFYLPAM